MPKNLENLLKAIWKKRKRPQQQTCLSLTLVTLKSVLAVPQIQAIVNQLLDVNLWDVAGKALRWFRCTVSCA